jgi:homocysteine S-methyltransferase
MQPLTKNPIASFIDRQGVVVLDGGMATTLEARGFDLDDELWSAKILLEAPEAIRQVHLDFLAGGADCITAASYQASLAGFRKRGLSEAEGAELLRLSVALAVEARHVFWSEPDNRRNRLRPLVAASVGPYGAFLADGSEYTGRYGIDDRDLREFHQKRWEILSGSQADLLACETIPSHQEARILISLLEETPGKWAWMSFSCQDETRLSDGSKLVDAVRDCDAEPRVAAVGINCTSPKFISALIAEARKGTEKPIMVYPNLGERYDSVNKTWLEAPPPVNWEKAPVEWAKLGATCIGGCCRVGPPEIAGIRSRLLP